MRTTKNSNLSIISKNQIISYLLIFVLTMMCMVVSVPMNAKAATPAEYSAVFNASFYQHNYSDLNRLYGNNERLLFQHFLSYGMKEGRQASEEFNVKAYRERYPDLDAAFGDNLPAYYMHYINFGKAEGRDARVNTNEPTKEMNFYDRSVFVGDSIINDFRSYVQTTGSSVANGSEFLTMDTFSLTHALKSVDDDNVQPSYQGAKRNVWDSIKLMDVDKVFLMFGPNDLRKNNYATVYSNYMALVAKLRRNNPGVRIYVISMTPVYEGATKGYLNKNTIVLLNEQLKNGAAANGYTYVDLYSAVADKNGNLPEDYSRDNYVHQNHRAFVDVWEKTLTSFATGQIAAGIN